MYHLASAPLAEDPTQQEALLKIDGVIPDRTRATYALADRLHKNVLADLSSMKEERSDMLYQSLGEFKVLIGELDDVSIHFLARSAKKKGKEG